MHGLDPDLRILMDEARGSHEPTAEDRERITRALVVRLGTGALAATAAVAITTKAGVAGVAASTATASGAVGGGAVAAAPVAAASGLGIVAKVVGVVALAGTVGVAASPALRERILPAVGHHEVARPANALRAAPRMPIIERLPSSSPRDTAALEREVRLLGEAQHAMRDGRAAHALGLLAEHQRQFPDGLLLQEGLAARVMALCALGRGTEARRDAAEFLRQWPGSPLSAQVRASCGHEPQR